MSFFPQVNSGRKTHFRKNLTKVTSSPLVDVVARATNHIATITDLAARTNRYYRLVTPRQP